MQPTKFLNQTNHHFISIYNPDTDDCASMVCQHGGTCQDGVNEYTCLCASGYTGDLCEQSKCRNIF